jgi:hypothetical protein
LRLFDLHDSSERSAGFFVTLASSSQAVDSIGNGEKMAKCSLLRGAAQEMQ